MASHQIVTLRCEVNAVIPDSLTFRWWKGMIWDFLEQVEEKSARNENINTASPRTKYFKKNEDNIQVAQRQRMREPTFGNYHIEI